jgi:hypothetical protein
MSFESSCAKGLVLNHWHCWQVVESLRCRCSGRKLGHCSWRGYQDPSPFSFLSLLPRFHQWTSSSATFSCSHVLSWHRPKCNGVDWPWTEIPQTVSQNKKSFLLFKLIVSDIFVMATKLAHWGHWVTERHREGVFWSSSWMRHLSIQSFIHSPDLSWM